MSADDPAPKTNDPRRTVAAVDLGSNSFHMLVARTLDGQVQVVDRLREMVQLGAGLDARNRLSPEAQERALDCLERFGQRLRSQPQDSVRVVGTNTLRKARGAEAFVARAEAALGHPVDIVSGIEEARLIYLGVAHSVDVRDDRMLVLDIGGGSTELIVGQRFEPMRMESLYMGCVSMSRDHFPGGVIRKAAWRKAELAAAQELEASAGAFRQLGWERAVGASGTVKAIARVLAAQGWAEHGITAAGLRRLRQALLKAGSLEAACFKGLTPERARVFAGGVVVLQAVFEALGLEYLEVSDGALREGVLYDLLGRMAHADVRERTVAALARQYRVDEAQAERVERTALALWRQVRGPWAVEAERWANALSWAARLHEIGLAVAHAQFHKHGGYLAQYSDLLGFSRQEQQLLAVLIRGHRRKFPSDSFVALAESLRTPAQRLCVLLRLAATLHRSRSPQALPALRLEPSRDGARLIFPHGWLDDHALTVADLDQETKYLARAGFELVFAETSSPVVPGR